MWYINSIEIFSMTNKHIIRMNKFSILKSCNCVITIYALVLSANKKQNIN